MTLFEQKVLGIIYAILLVLTSTQAALIILRITNTISISWWLVLIPLWIFILGSVINLFLAIKD